MSDHEEILNRVRKAVAEANELDFGEVSPSARYSDIDPESIGWLDLSFRLDKAFGVRIPGIGNFSSAETDAEGRFTPAGMLALRAFLPATLVDRVAQRVPAPTGKEFAEAITVEDIANMVEMALEAKKAVASS